MKVWLALLGLFILALAFGPVSGCGGGTGSTGTNGTGTTGTIVRYGVEATKGGAVIDPTNIVEGETVQFQIVGYTANNQRIVQSSSGWTTDPTGQSEGTLSSSGSFTASTYGPQFTVTGTSNSVPRTGKAQVRQIGGALVNGRIVDGYGNPVYGAQVDFYDTNNIVVGTAIAQGNGTFRASVPATAVTFEVNKSSIPVGYYKQFLYSGKWFLPQGVCRAPLPTLTAGQTTNLATDIQIPPTSNNGTGLPPPPPPSACS